MKIRPVGGRVAARGLTDGQTDTRRNFANAPKNSTKHNCRSANFLLHSGHTAVVLHVVTAAFLIARPTVNIAQPSTKNSEMFRAAYKTATDPTCWQL